MKTMSVAFCATVLAGSVSADLRVGVWERETVSDNTSLASTQTVAVAPEGTFDKTGPGLWSLDLDRILQPNPFEMGIRAGTATVVMTETVRPVNAPAVLEQAFLWLDAGRNTSPAPDGAGVSSWNDSREASAAAHAYYGMVAAGTVPTCVYRHGRSMVYFGGGDSGQFLQLETPARPGTASQVQTIRHAFFVADFDASYSYLMGGQNCHDMVIGSAGSSTSLNQTYFNPSENNSTAVFDARMYLDGAWIDGTATQVKRGLQVLEFEFCGKSPRVSYFFNDNGSHKGGDYLGEVLLFTNVLTSAERLDVNAYLARKWRGASAPSALSLAVADGATGVVEVATGGSACVDVSGRGLVRKTGDGTLFVSNGVPVSAQAALAVGSGTVTGLARALPCVLEPGKRLTAEPTSADGVTLASTAILDAKAVEKSGTGDVIVRALDAGVERLSVDAGTLILEGSRRTGDAVVPGTGVAATIPNADFEQFPAGWADKQFGVGETAYGWTAENRYVRMARRSAMAANHWMFANGYIPYDTPDGTVVMILENGGSAHAEISVPEDGDYELSFLSTTRKIWNQSTEAGAIDVELERDGAVRRIAHFQSFLGTGFHLHRHLVRGVAAGPHVLRFANCQRDNDGATGNTVLDAVRMVKVTRTDGRTAFPVPNGDFERSDFAYADATAFNSTTAPAAWTLAQNGVGPGTDPDVGVVFWRHASLFNHASARHGNVQLFFASNGGIATTAAFTPPAGTWMLRCRTGRWGFGDGWKWHGRMLKANPELAASVSVGGLAFRSLGARPVANNVFRTVTLPGTFTVDGMTPVVLTVSQPVDGAGMLVDDFELVAAEPDELVVDGGFETVGSWMLETSSGRNALRQQYASTTSWMGTARYEGNAYLYLDLGVASQAVRFPEDGVYRLVFHAAGRGDNAYYRGGRIRVWWGDGEVEHEIMTTPAVNGTGFREYTCLFRVPAGTHAVSFTGLKADKTLKVDGVSIRRATDEEETPDVPRSLELEVSAGARLRLDYSGTLELDGVRIGGRAVSGTVDAGRFPDVVSGPGAISVRPKVTVILFR